MNLVEVNDKKTIKQFLDVPRILYKDDPHWICPLDTSINKVFDPRKNIFFKHGKARRWILKDDQGKLIGRVAAFINEKKAFNYDQPTGGMGFFECIEDQEAAYKLFDQCKNWLAEEGMEAMDGPINFGENDNFWGLLVEGFIQPTFGMNYNFPYYQKFFEDYGFKSYFDQVSNHLNLKEDFPERFWKIADWIRKKPGYLFKHFSYKDPETFIDDLKIVYDKAWINHENYTPIHKKDLVESLKLAKHVLVEEFIWFVYFNNEPIAFLVMLPDANELFRSFNGKLNLINKLKVYFANKKKVFTRTRITIMGVVPEFQKKGVESAIFWHMNEVMPKWPKIDTIELSWVGDFNQKMRSLHESVGGTFAMKHITYRKLFGSDQHDSRHKTIQK